MSTIARAIIKSYDATTHSATVQIAGSLAVWLDGVPVSDGIAPADVVAGRECGVIFFTEDNPADAAIVTVHNAVPTGWPGTGYATVQDEGTPLTARSTMNFVGAGVTAADSGGVTTVTIPGGGVTAHSALTGLTAPADDHTQHPYLTGRAGGQTLSGGSAANEALTLQGTSHATHTTSYVLMSDHVRMASGKAFQDSAGTAQLTIATASPQVDLVNDLRVQGRLACTASGTAPVASIIGLFGRLANADIDGKIGLAVDMGNNSSGNAGTLVGVAGNAYVKTSSTTSYCYGLFFSAGYLTGTATMTLTSLACINAALFVSGKNTTVTNMGYIDTSMNGGTFPAAGVTTFIGLRIRDALYIGSAGSANCTTAYGVKVDAMTAGTTNAYPFYDEGIVASGNKYGNVFRTNTQFGSTTLAFGGGDGVIGIANATTNPSSNPSGGVVAWVAAATGHLNVRGSTGQICKLPTGGATNVTGSRGGNAALANLMSALAALGLVVDGTT